MLPLHFGRPDFTVEKPSDEGVPSNDIEEPMDSISEYGIVQDFSPPVVIEGHKSNPVNEVALQAEGLSHHSVDRLVQDDFIKPVGKQSFFSSNPKMFHAIRI